MYSFYGRLSVASTDIDQFREADLPSTYVLYGSNEVFRSQIENQVNLLEEAGVSVERHILDGYGHGFGARGDWFNDYDRFLTDVFENASDSANLLSVDEPVIESGTLSFTITVNTDRSDINIIAALYSDGALSAVRVNTLSGTFDLEPGKNYMMKVFAWTKHSMEPASDSQAFYDLQSDEQQEAGVAGHAEQCVAGHGRNDPLYVLSAAGL